MLWKIGSTSYECDTTSFVETVQDTGGEVTYTACGATLEPVSSTIVGATVGLLQGLEAADLWQYLRENDAAGTEVLTYTFGTSYTQSATNPIWTVTLSGWTKPAATWNAGGSGSPTSTFRLSFVAEPVVDHTP
jgi:isocitrate lyase